MALIDEKSPVSQYALYGEEPAGSDPEFLHIEDIYSRSRLHDWRIKPHVHCGLLQIIYAVEGAAEMMIDREKRKAEAPFAIIIPEGVPHGFEFAKDTSGWVLTISESLLETELFERSRNLFDPLLREPCVLTFSPQSTDDRELSAFFLQLAAEFRQSRIGRGPVLEWLVCLALAMLRRGMAASLSPSAPQSEHREVYAGFRRLLNEHYRDHWAVCDYAKALGIGQARLNRTCRNFSGKSAGDLIQARLLLEAQRNLIYSEASAMQIAYDIGFRDPAYFSRFFKRLSGVTPGQYRRSNRA